ncbi:MAG: hydrolase [Spirochaetes bacterium]|nr:MAG: hydrolase [Spirochaetota bacterium]
MIKKYSLSDAHFILPEKRIAHTSIVIEEKRICKIGGVGGKNFSFKNNYFVFPALINIHDHLRGTYLPRVGPKDRNYYLNWSYWDNDLKSSDVFMERSKISIEDCYFLGAYKNILSGVTTTNDHFPHEMNDKLLPLMPLRVIRNYALAHECSSFDLKWGEGIEAEHRKAVKKNIPFITHLEEGFDEESQSGIPILEKLGCLDNHDILIHCIGFSDEDIDKAKRAGANIAWCPGSNIFMFNVTCKIKKILEAGINVSIGTDSTATGSINLLEEMRYARFVYRRMYREELPPYEIFKMVTANPAKAFRLEKDLGTIEEGKLADLLVLKPRDDDPFEALLKTQIEDIVLLIKEGTPIFGSPDYEELFREGEVEYSTIMIRGKEKLVIGDPEGLLKRIRKAVGFNKVFDFMPIDTS